MIHGNAMRAAAEAGYDVGSSNNTGWQLVRRQSIREEIAARQAILREEATASSKDMLRRLHKIITSEDSRDSDAISAIDLMCRLTGAYPDKEGAGQAVIIQHVQLPPWD
jgi:phage terminase small subunit